MKTKIYEQEKEVVIAKQYQFLHRTVRIIFVVLAKHSQNVDVFFQILNKRFKTQWL